MVTTSIWNEAVTCCFIGNREIQDTPALRYDLCAIIEKRIVEDGVNTFLFGSRSQFNDLCLELVTHIREKRPHIKRIYVRAEFPHISEDYRAYLLERYDDTTYPPSVVGAGRAAYVKRNEEMIKNSRYCIFYEDESRRTTAKSGTAIALAIARKLQKEILVFP